MINFGIFIMILSDWASHYLFVFALQSSMLVLIVQALELGVCVVDHVLLPHVLGAVVGNGVLPPLGLFPVR